MAIDTAELMRQVRRIRVVTNRQVDEFLSGEYHSVFKGQGIEFDEVREYVSGDDVRSIDWNVTARMGYPFIKRFCEERELTIIFMVDVSGSQCFGSKLKSKIEAAAELTCLLALSAIKNQDKVGLVLFSDRIDKFIPPRKGRKAAMRLVREVLATEVTTHQTDISVAFRFLNKVQKRKAVVFLISDFMDSGYGKQLRIVSRKHDLICCSITDPRELAMVDAGLIEVEDPETGELCVIDTASRAFRESYCLAAENHRKALAGLFAKTRVDTISLSTDRPFVEDVRKLFKKRQARAAGR